MERFDFLILGSGFGGTIMAMVLRRLGHSVVLAERGRHPRFVIGESSTPFSNLLLEHLAEQYDLPLLRQLSEWGSWQETHPGIACGLKRGFTFYHHRCGEPLDPGNRATQLLVAASPNDHLADTHWYRPEFDLHLLRAAIELGASYLDEATLDALHRAGAGWRARIIRPDGARNIQAGAIIDGTGPGGALSRVLDLPESTAPYMPPTSAVYAHFRGVPRLMEPAVDHPYPPEDAAVHHVFDGGWIWILRFNNGITSAGAAFQTAGFDLPDAGESWKRLWQRFPTLCELFLGAEPVTPFYQLRQLSFARPQAAGPGWFLLPSAAGFVDPLLSTGFALNLLGIIRIGRLLQGVGDSSAYSEVTRRELDATADLISALYATMGDFEDFSRLTLLYFAAMSFTETAWRLGKSTLAPEFLLSGNQTFSKDRQRLCEEARRGAGVSRDEIARAIEPWDLAGLARWERNNWYPIDPGDLMAARNKVEASPREIMGLLKKAGLAGCETMKRPRRTPRPPGHARAAGQRRAANIR